MSLIDWAGVARNALWIVGLSLTLAALSYAIWQANVQRISLRKVLGRATFQMVFNFGLLLFSVGLAWGAAQMWERIVWILLVVAFAWLEGIALRADRFPGRK